MKIIHIAVAVIKNPDGLMLLVRKHGTIAFMQPGGKIEPNEPPASALARELFEELGMTVKPDELRYLGRANAPAANEPDHVVEADIFECPCPEEVVVQAELAEAIWFDWERHSDLALAPLTGEHVLPLVANA